MGGKIYDSSVATAAQKNTKKIPSVQRLVLSLERILEKSGYFELV